MRCRIFLLILSSFLSMAPTAGAQDATFEGEQIKTCNHGGYDLWDVMKMLPVRFTEFKAETAEWKYQDDYTVKLGSFVLRENAQYISREKKAVSMLYLMQRRDSDWLCYYCSRCHALLRAYELRPGSSHFE